MGTAINWKLYRVNCLRGAETGTQYIFEVYARDVHHAWELARGSGYTPLSLAR
jgi:hypothetical protein